MTPGLRYLLRILPSLLGPPYILYLLLSAAETHVRFSIPLVPRWLSSVSIWLSVTVLRLQWTSWVQRREAQRLGAVEVPAYTGKWPGNIDGVVKLAQSMNTGYIGALLWSLF